LVGVDGKDLREIRRGFGVLARNILWTRDGRYILFAESSSKGSRIMRVPANGGEPEFTGVSTPDAIVTFHLSPDGSRLAYGTDSTHAELWSLDNIASVKTGK